MNGGKASDEIISNRSLDSPEALQQVEVGGGVDKILLDHLNMIVDKMACAP